MYIPNNVSGNNQNEYETNTPISDSVESLEKEVVEKLHEHLDEKLKLVNDLQDTENSQNLEQHDISDSEMACGWVLIRPKIGETSVDDLSDLSESETADQNPDEMTQSKENISPESLTNENLESGDFMKFNNKGVNLYVNGEKIDCDKLVPKNRKLEENFQHIDNKIEILQQTIDSEYDKLVTCDNNDTNQLVTTSALDVPNLDLPNNLTLDQQIEKLNQKINEEYTMVVSNENNSFGEDKICKQYLEEDEIEKETCTIITPNIQIIEAISSEELPCIEKTRESTIEYDHVNSDHCINVEKEIVNNQQGPSLWTKNPIENDHTIVCNKIAPANLDGNIEKCMSKKCIQLNDECNEDHAIQSHVLPACNKDTDIAVIEKSIIKITLPVIAKSVEPQDLETALVDNSKNNELIKCEVQKTQYVPEITVILAEDTKTQSIVNTTLNYQTPKSSETLENYITIEKKTEIAQSIIPSNENQNTILESGDNSCPSMNVRTAEFINIVEKNPVLLSSREEASEIFTISYVNNSCNSSNEINETVNSECNTMKDNTPLLSISFQELDKTDIIEYPLQTNDYVTLNLQNKEKNEKESVKDNKINTIINKDSEKNPDNTPLKQKEQIVFKEDNENRALVSDNQNFNLLTFEIPNIHEANNNLRNVMIANKILDKSETQEETADKTNVVTEVFIPDVNKETDEIHDINRYENVLNFLQEKSAEITLPDEQKIIQSNQGSLDKNDELPIIIKEHLKDEYLGNNLIIKDDDNPQNVISLNKSEADNSLIYKQDVQSLNDSFENYIKKNEINRYETSDTLKLTSMDNRYNSNSSNQNLLKPQNDESKIETETLHSIRKISGLDKDINKNLNQNQNTQVLTKDTNIESEGKTINIYAHIYLYIIVY